MELTSGYEILSKDEFNNALVKYTLDSMPSVKWTQSFNKRDSTLNVYSIENTTSLILALSLSYFYINKIEINDTLSRKIIIASNEVNSDNLRHQTIRGIIDDPELDAFLGMIVIHDGLSYDETNIYTETEIENEESLMYNPDQYSDYEFYVRKIVENINLENF